MSRFIGLDLQCASLSEMSNGFGVYPRISIIEMSGAETYPRALPFV
jgi:hypothetical protein